MMKKLLKNERGDVIQFILVLAVVAIILAFAFPKFKSAMASGTNSSVKNMECAFNTDLQGGAAVLDTTTGQWTTASGGDKKCNNQ